MTDEQARAVAASGANILVSAAAGTGKTKVLVDRVIDRVTDAARPLDVDRLLVVTFTDAAAAEVRSRIAAALQQAVQAGGGDPRLERQFAQLNRAAISTLHSFCLGLLRRYFYRLDIDPAFRVMDEGEAALMQIDVIEEVLERRYAAPAAPDAPAAPGDGAFLALVEHYGGPRGDLALQDVVLRLYDYARSQPWPMEWLETAAAAYAIPAGGRVADLPWGRAALAGAALELERAAALLGRAADRAAASGGPRHWAAQLRDERAVIARVADACHGGDWAAAATAASGLTVAFKNLPRAREDDPAARAERDATRKLRDAAKGAVRRVVAAHFLRGEEELVAELRQVAPHVRALVDLVEDFDRLYRAARSARAVLDFSDLEHLCLELLAAGKAADEFCPSDVALELRQRFEEVLVDEYQDISPVQDAILGLASRQPATGAGPGRDGGGPWTPNLFLVGDVKQSIYRFRLAEPALFLRRLQGYPPYPRADEERAAGAQGRPTGAPPGWRIDLAANFRSRRSIIDAVNFIFRQVMSQRAGELAYDEAAELIFGASYPEATPDPPVELHLAERGEVGSGGAGDGGEGGGGGEPDRGGDDAGGGDGAGGGEGASGGQGGGADEPGGEPRDAVRSRGDLDIDELVALEREALLIAERIRDMIGGGAGGAAAGGSAGGAAAVWDAAAGVMRPMRYRDIAVLMRATRGRANVVVEALAKYGVPASAELGTGYFAAIEVEVALALLRVIDNPRQDIPLAAVLRSPVVGIDAAGLARIRLCRRRGDFYDAALAASSRDEDEPGLPVAELKRFLARLEGWRTAARRGPVSELVWRLFRDTGYLDYVGALPGGAQRQANLRALHDRARQFDQFARQGLFRFLRFIDRLRETAGDLGTPRALGENEDVVRIMSIHRSKGLEFPVVFLADLGKRFSREEAPAGVQYHRDLGLALDCVDLKLRSAWPTIAGRAIAARRRVEDKAEEMRILYVGMTRARERLILVGSALELEKPCARWASWADRRGWPLEDAELIAAETYLDWIGPALARHAAGAPLRAAGAARRGEDGATAEPADAAVRDHPSRWDVRLWDVPGLNDLAARRRLEPITLAGPLAPSAPGVTAAPSAIAAPSGPAPASAWFLPADAPWDKIAALEPLDDAIAPPRDPVLAAEVARRLAWRYPHAPAAGRAAKVTVSELKRLYDHSHEDAELREAALRAFHEATLTRRPRFLSLSERLTAAERGSAAHVVMQHLDLGAALDEADVRAQIKAMVDGELLIAEHAAAVDAAAVARLMATPLGLMLRERRAALLRELPFSIALPAREIHPGIDAAAAGDDRVLVQGMIDCLVPVRDGFILVDFKTDRADDEGLGRAAARYHGQLAVYARAAAMIFGQPVKEAHLAFVGEAGGRAIAVALGGMPTEPAPPAAPERTLPGT